MKKHKPLLLFAIVIVCLTMMQPLQAVEAVAAIQDSQGTVSEELVQSKLAESRLQDVEGKHPLLVRIARQNAVLSNEIVSVSNRLKQLRLQTEQVNNQASQVKGDYERAREIIDIGGLSKGMGYMLLQQHYVLPDRNSLRRQARNQKELAAEVGVKRLLHREERKQLRDIDAYIDQILVEVSEQQPSLHNELKKLLKMRLELLEKALEYQNIYLKNISKLESAQQILLDDIDDYTRYLSVHLFLARSASRDELEALGVLPEKAWRILSPDGWLGVLQVLRFQVTHSPVFIFLVLMIATLFWYRKPAIAAINASSGMLGRPETDHFIYTIKSLLFTLIAVIPLPLAVAVTGWQLKISSQSTVFSIAVGSALLMFAIQFFYIRAIRMMCMTGGLADAHFCWPESSLVLLRRELNRLSWIYLPAALVSFITFYLDRLNAGWEVGQTAFLIMVGSLSFAFYKLLHPVRGVFAGRRGKVQAKTDRHLQWPLYVLLVIFPLALGLLSLMDYLYTAGNLLSLMLQTCWLLVALIILTGLAHRWLLVMRRRLVYEAAKQAAKLADEENDDADSSHQGLHVDVDEPEVDLVTLSDTSLKLLNTSILVLGFIGLWMIWDEVLPALRIFENASLWHHTLTVDGVEQRLPITLIDIGLAMIYGVATLVLVKQLPAVLEIILLQRTGMTSSGRYTVTTLVSYVITVVGIILVFSTLGVHWSQLQWLVAALGVGIGFGLQEIVANFISGIIILFERPVRVGDLVTIGDTRGIVTKIRIRATTIRTHDAQELLVPNKEFITGRLLNWSLSDQVTRLLIPVGIAYGSDVDKAMALMLEAAREDVNVIDDPAPSVIFESFGDNSLQIILRCFVCEIDKRVRTISALNQAVNKKFNEAGIVIAFPQRDLHIDSSKPLSVKIEDASQEQKESGNSS
jgi:potassium efflux system protein